jgi:hypothetical protein
MRTKGSAVFRARRESWTVTLHDELVKSEELLEEAERSTSYARR